MTTTRNDNDSGTRTVLVRYHYHSRGAFVGVRVRIQSSCSQHGRALGGQRNISRDISAADINLLKLPYLQGLGEQKRTKYKINGTATTAIEKSNPNRPAKSRLPYSYQEHEQGEQQRQPRDSHQLPQTESVT